MTQLLILFLIFVPGAIPVYCMLTFMDGLFDPDKECNQRWQVYSCYRLGVKANSVVRRFYNWMTERVR